MIGDATSTESESPASTTAPRLSAEGLSVAYGRISALEPLSFEVQAGGLLLVLGPNGAGKTSLVRALAGAIEPREGTVLVDGVELTFVPAHRRVRAGVSLVPEGRGTLPGLSVLDNLELGRHAAARERRGNRDEDLASLFRLFPILESRLAQDCSTLSGGEMQMLAIARALLAKPTVLLLDEPSLGLAPLAIAQVYEALDRLAESGLAIVLVEQRVVPGRRVPDTTLVLHRGRVIHEEHGRRPSDEELAELYLGPRRGAVS